MSSIIGIDEVGRGCWAGPLVAAAVKLNLHQKIDYVTDSKVISPKKRRQLSLIIREAATQIGIGCVTTAEINQLGLTQSVRLAMERAVDQLSINSHDRIVIDGNIDYLVRANSEAQIKADATIPAVSAASIVAKVARDEYMIALAKEYPGYGFETNMGYGTQKHISALRAHGVLSHIHRVHYKPIKAMLAV